ncbi:MAG: S26 family signal peptidase [Planctomycetota bacterium]|nr:S26 family signal peptidase [Planctomycetota bacterium]
MTDTEVPVSQLLEPPRDLRIREACVRDYLFAAIRYVLLVGSVLAVFWLIKWHNRVKIPTGAGYMEPEYPPGNYSLKADYKKASDLLPGTAVAFYMPDPGQEVRLAWVIAHEGQTISIEPKKGERRKYVVKVNKQEAAVQPITGLSAALPEIVVPKDCVFLLANQAGIDSLKYGPIPLRLIKGRLN